MRSAYQQIVAVLVGALSCLLVFSCVFSCAFSWVFASGVAYADTYADTTDAQSLTPEEQEFLQQKGSLRYGMLTDNLPISGAARDAAYGGVAGDIMKPLEQYLGVALDPVYYTGAPALKQALADDEIDFAFPIFDDTWLAEAAGICLTKSIVKDRVMIAYVDDYRDGLMNKVAVSSNALGQRDYIRLNSPDTEICFFNNRKVCLMAVKSGKANCMIGAASVLQRFLLEQDDSSNLNVAYLNTPEDFSIGVKASNSTLAVIMKKAALQIDSSLVNDAMIHYAQISDAVSISEAMRNNATWIILFISLVVAIVLYALIRWRRSVRAYNREQASARKELEEALASANAANDTKTSFLSKMSHDIRTPMNAIIGMTAIATANIEDKKRVEECLEKISVSSEHLLRLINDILDISKIDSGKIELTKEPFALSGLLKDLMAMHAPLAHEKNLNMSCSSEGVTHNRVVGDRMHLQQIYMNLISNAIKYTPEGGIINIVLSEHDADQPNVKRYVFSVQDNGIGISADYLPHVFKSFTRSDQQEVRKTQGTGIGMPIAYNIAQMMDGDITVSSREGIGSTFIASVLLNIASEDEEIFDSEDAFDALDADDSGSSSADEVSFVGKRALLAEDNELNAEIATDFLSAAGFEIDWAANGKEALDNFEASDEGYYDCIFMDVQMPVMSGIDATKAIRMLKRSDAKKVPIFAMTGDAFVNDIKQAKAAGMNEHFSKPIDFALVFNVIRKYLR